MPAEWEPHEAIWLQWPDESMREYAGYGVKLESTWLEMVRVLHEHVKVRIVAGTDAGRDRLYNQFRHFGFSVSNMEVFVFPVDDVWARDNGPIFVRDASEKLCVTGWQFNGWGGRSPSDRDSQLALRISDDLQLPFLKAPIVLEGGAVEVDGLGNFMATRSSILNSNRNPGLEQEKAEKIIGDLLGVSNFIWLSGAPPDVCESLGDCTDFHIDIAARFTPSGAIFHCSADDTTDPRHSYLKRHQEELQSAVDIRGRKFDLVELPTPRARSVGYTSVGIRNATDDYCHPGRPVDASYTNYLVTNGLVAVPVYGCAEDERAKAMIAEHFPGRKVIGIPALSLNEEGGAMHCISQQQPIANIQKEKNQ